MNTPEGSDASGTVFQDAEETVVAHLAGLEDAVDDLAERLESLGREGASSTTAALTEVLGLVRGLDPAAGVLVASLQEEARVLRADLAGALTELGRLVGPGLTEVRERLTALEQAQADRDERLADVLRGFSDAISTALGRLGDQLGRPEAWASPAAVDPAAPTPGAVEAPPEGRRRGR